MKKKFLLSILLFLCIIVLSKNVLYALEVEIIQGTEKQITLTEPITKTGGVSSKNENIAKAKKNSVSSITITGVNVGETNLNYITDKYNASTGITDQVTVFINVTVKAPSTTSLDDLTDEQYIEGEPPKVSYEKNFEPPFNVTDKSLTGGMKDLLKECGFNSVGEKTFGAEEYHYTTNALIKEKIESFLKLQGTLVGDIKSSDFWDWWDNDGVFHLAEDKDKYFRQDKNAEWGARCFIQYVTSLSMDNGEYDCRELFVWAKQDNESKGGSFGYNYGGSSDLEIVFGYKTRGDIANKLKDRKELEERYNQRLEEYKKKNYIDFKESDVREVALYMALLKNNMREETLKFAFGEDEKTKNEDNIAIIENWIDKMKKKGTSVYEKYIEELTLATQYDPNDKNANDIKDKMDQIANDITKRVEDNAFKRLEFWHDADTSRDNLFKEDGDVLQHIGNYKPGEIDPESAGKIESVTSKILTVVSNIGIAVSVIILAILGIKYMLGSVEEKAEYKQGLIPYVIGVFILLGITTIVKVIMTIGDKINAI